APVAAAAVGIDRLIESDIGRVVAGDDAARAVGQHGFVRILRDLLLVPPVMRLLVDQRLESPRRIRCGASALDGLMTDEAACHGQTVRAAAASVNPVRAGAQYCI